MSDLAAKYEKWLVASLAYYDKYESIMSDGEWDMLGRELTAKWDDWNHPDKNLVNKGEMFSGFDLCYPNWVHDRLQKDYGIV